MLGEVPREKPNEGPRADEQCRALHMEVTADQLKLTPQIDASFM